MLDSESQLCRKWVEQQKGITRVYFFGSRVWGNPHPNSDLDVLFVAEPALAILKSEEWEKALTNLLGAKIHLNKHFLADSELVSRIKSEGQLVFSRYKSDRDFEFEELDEIDVTKDHALSRIHE